MELRVTIHVHTRVGDKNTISFQNAAHVYAQRKLFQRIYCIHENNIQFAITIINIL